MVSTARWPNVLSLLRDLGQPDWLLLGECVEFSTYDSFDLDHLNVRATLESPTRRRAVDGRLSGRLLRIYQYTQRASVLVEALGDLHALLLNRLRLVLDHPLQALACRALDSAEDLAVFTDAVLERGEIRQDDVGAQALGYARSIVAPLIFTGWQSERWPVNDGLRFTGLEIQGHRGPIRVYTRSGDMPDGPYNIRVTGDIGVAE